MLNIILYILLVVILVAFIVIIIDVFSYLYNEIQYANGVITFNEYIENWMYWEKHTFLGKLTELINDIYFYFK